MASELTTPCRNNGWSSTTRILIRSFIVILHRYQGEVDTNQGATPRRTLNFERSPQNFNALAHAAQAQPPLGACLIRVKARALVTDLNHQRVRMAVQDHSAVLALRVTPGISQRFLQQAVQRHLGSEGGDAAGAQVEQR